MTSLTTWWKEQGAPGETPGLFFMKKLISFLLVSFTLQTHAQNREATQSNVLSDEEYFTQTHPFVPQTIDYSLEIGSMWENNNLYWLSGSVGFHLGKCLFTETQTCQQYADIFSGVGGRDAETHGLLTGGLRWQWVNFPSSWSPLARVFAGIQNTHEPRLAQIYPVFGVGLGWTTYLHERADLRVEMRVGKGREVFSQSFIGLQVKMDKLVEYFASKLKDFGVGTAKVTSSVIKGTLKTSGESLGTVIQEGGKAVGSAVEATGGVISSPFKSDEPKKNDSNILEKENESDKSNGKK
jgi:hypothetical protein